MIHHCQLWCVYYENDNFMNGGLHYGRSGSFPVLTIWLQPYFGVSSFLSNKKNDIHHEKFWRVRDAGVLSGGCSYLKHRGPIDIDCVVVHHLHNCHTEVATDAKGDAEAQAAEDGNDVALGQAATAAVQQRGGTWRRCHRTPVLRQFNVVLLFYIATIYFPEKKVWGNKSTVRAAVLVSTFVSTLQSFFVSCFIKNAETQMTK